MSIGPDIKEAIVEVGTKYSVLRDSGNITGQYLNYRSNAQVTKPFIREFFLEAQFCYNTVAIGGDIVQLITTGEKYLVMNSTPKMFEDSIISYDVVLYKTNIVVTLLRPSEVRDPDTYEMRTFWTTVFSGKPALMTSPLYGIDLDTDEELGLLGLQIQELYVPASYGLQVMDRLRLSTGEFYRVETIKKRRYSGIEVMDVGEDTRASTSTTTTTTTSSSSTSTTTTSP